jgi:A/G-specific adenine glycosylase
LLRRTTAQAVSRIYDNFVESYPSIEHLSKANIAQLENDLKTIGYQKVRARLIKEVATELFSTYRGIPDSLEKLLSVKHIGLYTAAAIISLGYGKPLPMIDTNVIRILSRVYGSEITQKQAFDLLKVCIPSNFKEFNLGLLDFGALVCRYKNPLCNICPVRGICAYPVQTKQLSER